MTPRTYASPDTFKQALEQRLQSAAISGAEFARKPQLACDKAPFARPTHRDEMDAHVASFLRRVSCDNDV